MARNYVVIAPLATPYREDGSRVYIYQGAPFVGVRDGEVERFLDLGFIAETDVVPVPDEEPAGDVVEDDEPAGDVVEVVAPARKAAARKATVDPSGL